jgi:hypothetical protein
MGTSAVNNECPKTFVVAESITIVPQQCRTNLLEMLLLAISLPFESK